MPPDSARASSRRRYGANSSRVRLPRICCSRRSGFRARSASSAAARSASQVKARRRAVGLGQQVVGEALELARRRLGEPVGQEVEGARVRLVGHGRR